VASPVTVVISLSQFPVQLYEYWAVAVFVGAAPLYVGVVPYSTFEL